MTEPVQEAMHSCMRVCVRPFSEHNLNSPRKHATLQPWPVKHTCERGRWEKYEDRMMEGGWEQEERGAATAKDSHNVTERAREGGRKNSIA